MRYKFIVIFFREKISLYETMIAEIVKSGYIFKIPITKIILKISKKAAFRI